MIKLTPIHLITVKYFIIDDPLSTIKFFNNNKNQKGATLYCNYIYLTAFSLHNSEKKVSLATSNLTVIPIGLPYVQIMGLSLEHILDVITYGLKHSKKVDDVARDMGYIKEKFFGPFPQHLTLFGKFMRDRT